MCNLYSLTKGQAAIRDMARAMRDTTGNLPPLPGIFPDQMAPVVRAGRDGGERELAMMRWGFPAVAKPGARPITNVRNLGSSYWRGWLKPEFRCVVPATSFCEYDARQHTKRPTWFALGDDRPLFAFAGIWRPWTGTRGTKAHPVEGEHLLYAFLTTEANAVVQPVHPKAMPVILRTAYEIDRWMTAPAEEALELQRPLLDDALQIVATGPRKDGADEARASSDMAQMGAGRFQAVTW
jgi:putative SOS response-associated peptidase YedK